MVQINNVVYTHSSYSDVWPILFGQSKKYSHFSRQTLFTDKIPEGKELPDDWDAVFYDDSKTYTERVIECLKQIDSELLIFSHEDMFLYDNVQHELLDKYAGFLLSEESADCIRLIVAGEHTGIPVDPPGLVRIPRSGTWHFAIQPTMIKKDSFLKLFKAAQKTNIWDLEKTIQKVFVDLEMNAYFCPKKGKKRGKHHFDSLSYPYVATAIVKGKWNTKEYSDVLNPIFVDYSINREERGCR